MWWAWVLLGLVVVPLVLLAVPVHVAVRAARAERTEYEVRVRWLGGLVRKRIQGPRDPTARDGIDVEDGAQGPAEPPDDTERQRGGGGLAFVRTHGVPRALRHLVRRTFRAVHIGRLEIDGEVGTGDPAETGQLFGALGPVVAIVGSMPRTRVDVRPTFDAPAARGRAEGDARAVPLLAVAAVTMFVLTPATVRGFVAMRRART